MTDGGGIAIEQVVFLNGKLVTRSQARVSAFDHGFLYGYALFETMRAYSGHVFRLRDHLNRLGRSARVVGIPLDASPLERACYDTLKANRLADARVRLTVSIGEGEGIPDAPAHPRPTVLIAATSYTPPPSRKYRAGFKAIVSSVRQNSRSPLSRLKSANYLNNLLARKEAREAGADEALLLNERGLLCEGSTSNIFLVSGGSLITPDVESGCLPGVTRQAVIELAAQMGVAVSQRETLLEELLQADECFITNSLLEVMPLREVDGRHVGLKGKGEVTRRLIVAYRELVTRETKTEAVREPPPEASGQIPQYL